MRLIKYPSKEQWTELLKRPALNTESLFDTVTMVNYLEGSIDPNEKLDIPIEAMAVQWNVDTADAGLEKIYEHYLDQKAYNDEEGIWK
mgnify:CR=1 FL=1